MDSMKQLNKARLLTSTELAGCIRLFREERGWSQEQLAEISNLNVRTIQRVERGLSASLDTRRALCRAFEFKDIDALNKPFFIPTEEELKVAKEKFEKDYVTVTATPLMSGRKLAKLAETCSMDLSEPAFELSREADEIFATLIDYFRDYRDCFESYSEAQKIEVYEEIQVYIDSLKLQGVSLCYAERKVVVKWGTLSEGAPVPANVLYLIAFPLGNEPKQFSTPRSGGMRL